MKIFRIFNVLIFSVTLISLTMSCESNEPETDGPIEIPTYKPSPDRTKAIIDFSGERLVALDGYKIEYDKYFIKRIYKRYDYYAQQITFNYPDGKFSIYPDSFYGILKFNERGYLSHLERYNTSWASGHTFYESIRDTITIDFSYNDKGYLTGYSTKHINDYYYYRDDDYSDTYIHIDTESLTTTESLLDWEDGKITKLTVKGIYSDADGNAGEIKKYYYVAYNSLENKFRQYPLFFSEEMLLPYPLNIMASIGLLGKGPDILPSKITLSDYSYNASSEDNKEETVGIMEYSLNENGSIKTEQIEKNGDGSNNSTNDPIIYQYEYSK